jgi:deoxyribodipyrimidine photo-lyase
MMVDVTYSFPTDYRSILERIDAIDPIKYGKSRNYITGAVTYLSPYISRGVITLPQVMRTVLLKGYNIFEIQKFIQELTWREYYQKVWFIKGKQIAGNINQPQPDVEHYSMVSAVLNASTGIEAIDKHIKILQQTGYVHNHMRMYIASIACNVAKAHWKIPAQWMYYYLLDGDLASNNCSWQAIVASFSNKKYYANQENINKYTGSTQTGGFLDTSYDVLPNMPVPAVLKATEDIILDTTLPKTEIPIIDNTKPTLIYNYYNTDPLWRQSEDVNRVLLLEPSHFKEYPVVSSCIQFVMELAKNIPGIQIHVGELADIAALYASAALPVNEAIISKAHPAYSHYLGIKDEPVWLFNRIQGFFTSFHAYWKRCEPHIKQLQYL